MKNYTLLTMLFVVACPAPEPQPSYFGGQQQQYQQQPYPQQQQPYPQQQQPYPQQQQPYPQQQQPYPQQQQPYTPPPPPPPAPVANARLTCTQTLDQCYRTTDPNAQQQCVNQRASLRAQWWVTSIAKCAKIQNCSVQWCIEQGCPEPMKACRADNDPNGPLPWTFEGEWYYGGVSMVGFYSPTSGWTSAGSAGGSLQFNRDGTYEKATMLTQTMYGCGAGAFGWSTGRYSVQGDQLTLTETQSKINAANGCGGSRQANDLPLKTETYTLHFEPDDFYGKPTLTLYVNGQAFTKPYSHR